MQRVSEVDLALSVARTKSAIQQPRSVDEKGFLPDLFASFSVGGCKVL